MTEPNQPFDLSALRLPTDFTAEVMTRKVITTIPAKKPGAQDFFRIHPAETFQLATVVLVDAEDRETYLVDRNIWGNLATEVVPKLLVTYLTKSGVLGLWPIRLPDSDGRLDAWNRSALEGAELARGSWVRMTSNRALGAYEFHVASGDLGEPEWPDLSFEEIVKIAFKGKFIDSLAHPLLKKLRGEI